MPLPKPSELSTGSLWGHPVTKAGWQGVTREIHEGLKNKRIDLQHSLVISAMDDPFGLFLAIGSGDVLHQVSFNSDLI